MNRPSYFILLYSLLSNFFQSSNLLEYLIIMTALSNSIDKEKLKVINIVLLIFNFIIVYLLILLLNLLNFFN